MLKITFDKESVQDAFVCKLRDLGITNVDPASVAVTVKTLRDGSGGAEAEIEFDILTGKNPNSCKATASSKSCCNESEPESNDDPIDPDSGLDFPDSVGSDKSTDSMFG